MSQFPRTVSLEESASYNRNVLAYIHGAAERGLYDIRGLGAKRKLPTFDDLTFLTASASRYPLEGYREKCVTKTVLGGRRCERPVVLDTPVTVAGYELRGPLRPGQGRRSAGPPRPWARARLPATGA